ncbi:MAG: hypothetical protein ABIW82_17820 [Dokdonella sp.]
MKLHFTATTRLRSALNHVLFLSIASLSAAHGARAADGYFDTTFGTGGVLLVDVSADAKDAGQAMQVLPDGRLFLAGTCYRPEPPGIGVFPAFCATRLHPDGSYDSSFGPGGVGYVRFDQFNASDLPNNTALYDAIRLRDGRMLFVGRPTGSGIILAALKADGTALDPNVGGGGAQGYVQFGSDPPSAGTPFDAHGIPSRLIEQSDGKILVSGSDDGPTGNADFSIMRVLPDLSGVDSSFGTNGRQTVTFDLGGPSGINADVPAAMALQTDGKILLAGYAQLSATTLDISIARLLPNGQADTSFGPNHDGRVHLAPASVSALTSVLLDRQKRIVIGGISADPGNTYAEWYVDRLLSDGSQDPAFNGGSSQRFLIRTGVTSGSQSVKALTLQPDGKILAVGSVSQGAADTLRFYWGVARLLDDGMLDPSFGIGGRSYASFGSSPYTDETSGIAVADGGIVIAGNEQVGTSSGDMLFGVAKFQLDAIFVDGFEP